jgi:hypothetical protein
MIERIDEILTIAALTQDELTEILTIAALAQD